jgi:hypothetical protein
LMVPPTLIWQNAGKHKLSAKRVGIIFMIEWVL